MAAQTVVGAPMAVALLMGCAAALFFLLKAFNNWYFTVPDLGKGVKMPPGDLGFPVVGEMLDFIRCFKSKPDDFIRKRIAKFGKVGVLRSYIFGRQSILTVTPEFTRFVLMDDKRFPVSFPGSNKMFGKKSIAVIRGEEHIRLRKYVTSSLSSPRAMRNAIPVFTRVIRASLKRWAEKGTVVLEDENKEMMMKIIIETFLSKELPKEKILWIIHQLDLYMDGIRNLPIYFPGTAHYKAVQAKNRLLVFIGSEIQERRANKDSEKPDFLQEMMACKDDQGLEMNDGEIGDNMVGLMLAGFRSTAYFVLWLVVFAARDPKLLERLREEHLRIRNSKGEGEMLTMSDISSLAAFTNNVINEALRLVSISPFSFREAVQDVDFRGYRFPKGWRVLTWSRALHMDPLNFRNPETFDPDRWETTEGQTAHYSGAFVPWGGGSRKCPGAFYVKITSVILIHHLALDYDWENVNAEERRIKYLPQPRPVDGGLIRIRAR